MAVTTHREITEVARLRRRYDTKAEAAHDDAALDALGRELNALDRRMTAAANLLLASRTLGRNDLTALARVLQHFSELGEYGGVVLDDRPIVERALGKLLGSLCSARRIASNE